MGKINDIAFLEEPDSEKAERVAGIKGRLDAVRAMAQAQNSLQDQLRELIAVADARGLYDAADWLREKSKVQSGPWPKPSTQRGG